MASETPFRPRDLRAVFSSLEMLLRRDLQGKTLLGEVVFTEKHCDNVAGGLARLVGQRGAARALSEVIQHWPYVLAVWLVNEAFFNFVSGTYWPNVLGKIGIENPGPHSVRAGRAFVDFLERRNLPRFRRLKTRWSYLGPILAHSGVPRSCLPEFFERVLPRAAEYGVADGEGFEDLQHDLPRLYLTKPTERFLLFGEQIAQDFLRRSVELRSVWLTDRSVPDADVVGLPPRVIDAFREWTEKGPRESTAGSGRRLIRPVLRVDPGGGLVLVLPAERLEPSESSLRWIIEPEPGAAEHVEVRPQPGQRTTEGEEFVVPEPFSSLKVRLTDDIQGLGSWAFRGVARENPVLFFDADSLAVLSSRAVVAGPVGIAHPNEWRVIGGSAQEEEVPAPVLEEFGALPFAWQHLSAHVYDLTGFEHVLVRSPDGEASSPPLELGEVTALRPRLVCNGGTCTRGPDGTMVMIGGTPEIEIWRPAHQSEEDFRRAWSIEFRPDQDMEGRLAPFERALVNPALAASERSGNWWGFDLAQHDLLGPAPWGQFDVRARGPIGQDARFTVRLVPEIQIAHDWSEWSDHPDYAECRVIVPSGAELRGVEPKDGQYVIRASGKVVVLHLETDGFGGRRWDLPFDLDVPLPSWSVYEPQSSRQLLSWSRQPLSLSLKEVESPDAVLLVRLATPWGKPKEVEFRLRDAHGDVCRDHLKLDANGYGKIGLAPFLAACRQRMTPRLDLEVELALRRPVVLLCAQIQRRWDPRDFSCTIADELLILRWTERVHLENRAIEIHSVFMPWERSVIVNIPNDATGSWEMPASAALAVPGRYRVTLGINDPWTGRFEPAAEAATTVDLGGIEDWARSQLFSDTGPSGYLYRRLLAHYTGEVGSLDPPEFDDVAERRRFATRAFRTRRFLLEDDSSRPLREELGGILGKLPVEDVLAAIASHPEDFDPRAILRARLFTRPWHHASPLRADDNLDVLWRIWRPLGAWADLRLLRTASESAEARLLQRLGEEMLRLLSPLQPGSGLTFWDLETEEQVRARVLRVDSDSNFSPFAVARIRPGVVLFLRGESPEAFEGRQVLAQRDAAGAWQFEPSDADNTLPSCLVRVSAHASPSLGVFYPAESATYGAHPDPPIVALVQAGNWVVLDAIHAHCLQLPGSPISDEAFSECCFMWARRVAEDPERRRALVELCQEVGLAIAGDLERSSPSPRSKAECRILRELRARWFPNAWGEPLFAVNYLTWGVALATIWRGAGRMVPFSLREEVLEDAALGLLDLAPELFEHDLLKVCAIEAMDRTRELNDEP